MEELIIIGAGQYGQNVRDIVASNGGYDKISFADDNSSLSTYNISQAINTLEGDFFVAIGDSLIREQLLKSLSNKRKNIITIVHKSAFVANSASISEGSILEPNVVVLANTRIGKGTFVCSGSIVNHNAIIGDFCHIDVGAIVSARSKLPNNTKIASGEVYV